MFDHVQIKVSDFSSSLSFYKACLEGAGYGLLFETPGVMAGFGTNTHSMLVIRQAEPTLARSHHVHMTIKMADASQVKAFHQKALIHGGTDNGAPGFSLHYGEGYYAAAVVDPDGHHVVAVMYK